METHFINHADFDPARLVESAVDSKKSKPKPPANNPNGPPESVSYFETALMYNYKTKNSAGQETTVVAPLLVEGPELFSSTGIQTKVQAEGNETASLFTTFDLTNEEIANFVACPEAMPDRPPGFFEKLYQAVVARIFAIRGQIPFLARITTKDGIAGVTGYPIYWPRDTTTSQIVKGKNPTKFFNLISYGKPGAFNRKETLFNVPIIDEKTGTFMKLDWAMLKGVEMRFKPLLSFKKIYIGGGKASVQFEIASAIVTHIVRANTQSNQTETLKSMSTNSQLQQTLQSQIAQLTASFSAAKIEPMEEKKEEKAPGSPVPVAPPTPVATPPAVPLPTPTPTPTLPGLPTPGFAAFTQGPTLGGLPGLPGLSNTIPVA